MGTSIHQYTVKKLYDAKPGELIRHRYARGSALAIVVEQKPEETKLIYLSGPEGEEGPMPPHWYWHHRDNSDCVSYGTEWAVEPYNASILFADQSGPQSGALAITPKGLAIMVAADRPGQAAGTFLVDSMADERGNFPHFRRWRLWLNSQERMTPGAQPVFEHAEH